MLEAVASYGWALHYAPAHLRGDKEVVLKAVASHGLALQYAPAHLRGDKEVVLKAVASHGLALQYAPAHLRGDKEVVLKAVANDGLALPFASEELRNDLVRAKKPLGRTSFLGPHRQFAKNSTGGGRGDPAGGGSLGSGGGISSENINIAPEDGDSGALDAILAQIAENKEVSAEVVSTLLAHLAAERAVAFHLPANQDVYVRKVIDVLAQLVKRRNPEVIRAMISRLAVEEPALSNSLPVRVKIVRALAQFPDKGNEEVVKAVLDRVEKDIEFVSVEAVRVLVQLAEQGDKKVIGALSGIARSSSRIASCSVRVEAVKTLAQLAEQGDSGVIEMVSARLADRREDSGVRVEAIKALTQLAKKGDSRIVKVISDCFADTRITPVDVRVEAVRALAQLVERGDETVIGMVSEHLRDKEQSLAVRVEAVKTLFQLAKQGDRKVIEVFSECLKEDYVNDVRSEAVKGLAVVAEKGDAEVLAAIESRFKDKEHSVRKAAVTAYVQLVTASGAEKNNPFTDPANHVTTRTTLPRIAGDLAESRGGLAPSPRSLDEAARHRETEEMEATGRRELIAAVLERLEVEHTNPGGVESVRALAQLPEQSDRKVIEAVSAFLAAGRPPFSGGDQPCPSTHGQIEAIKTLTALAKKGDKEVVAVVSACLADVQNVYLDVRVEAVRALSQLAKQGDKDVIKVVSGCLPRINTYGSAPLRVEAIKTLAQLAEQGDAEVLATILSRLKDTELSVRKAAYKAHEQLVVEPEEEVLGSGSRSYIDILDLAESRSTRPRRSSSHLSSFLQLSETGSASATIARPPPPASPSGVGSPRPAVIPWDEDGGPAASPSSPHGTTRPPPTPGAAGDGGPVGTGGTTPRNIHIASEGGDGAGPRTGGGDGRTERESWVWEDLRTGQKADLQLDAIRKQIAEDKEVSAEVVSTLLVHLAEEKAVNQPKDQELYVRKVVRDVLAQLVKKGNVEVTQAMLSHLRSWSTIAEGQPTSNSHTVRVEIVKALAQFPEKGNLNGEVIAALLQCLEVEIVSVRLEAVRALAQLAKQGDKQVIGVVVSALSSSPGAWKPLSVREEVIKTLAQLAEQGGNGVIEVERILSRFLADHSEDSGGRVEAIKALAQLAKKGDSRADVIEVISDCFADVKKSTPVDVRVEAVRALAHLVERSDETVIGMVSEHLSDIHQSVAVRVEAIKTLVQLAKQGDRKVIGVFSECLKEDYANDVRIEAVKGLVQLAEKGDSGVIGAVSACFADEKKNTPADVRAEAVRALAQLVEQGDEKVIGMVSKHLSDIRQSVSVRVEAVKTLVQLAKQGDRKVIEVFSECLKEDYVNDVRSEAVKGLAVVAEKGDAEVLAAIESRFKDKEHSVRKAAVTAYVQLVTASGAEKNNPFTDPANHVTTRTTLPRIAGDLAESRGGLAPSPRSLDEAALHQETEGMEATSSKRQRQDAMK